MKAYMYIQSYINTNYALHIKAAYILSVCDNN